jgi:hypothetical protein
MSAVLELEACQILATMEQRKVPEPWKEGNDKQPDVLD